MTISRVLAAAVVLVGVAVGSAGPASADQVMEGEYLFVQQGVSPATWLVTPLCVPVVGDLREPLELPVSCVLRISGSSLEDTAFSGTYSGDARLVSGRWTLNMSKVDGMTCPDGSKAGTTEIYSWDDATLSGTHTTSYNAVCGKQPGLTKEPFTLTFVRPLQTPVVRYPLQCEPPGTLRGCY